MEHGPKREGNALQRLTLVLGPSHKQIHDLRDETHLEVNDRGRGLIKKFIISIGKFIIMGISKFKTNATFRSKLASNSKRLCMDAVASSALTW